VPEIPILDVTGLQVSYGRGSARRQILHGVDLRIAPGETVGLVGETGSGKTTLARAVLGLAPIEAGTIAVNGLETTTLRPRDRRAWRRQGSVQYVFQDPLQSLDPELTVATSIAEGLTIRGGLSKAERAARVDEAIRTVGLPAELGRRLPAELSGGQRQRIAIARTLVLDPRLLVLDEPVSALDAANRNQILGLLRQLAQDRGIAQLFISHDLGSVAGLSDRIEVIYRGDIVETGTASDIINRPQHPYTRLLIGSAPTITDGGIDRATRQQLRRTLAASTGSTAEPKISQ